MGLFDVDFDIISQYLTPVRKRLPIHLAWLRVFVAPIKELRTAFFDVYFVDVSKRAKRNGQKLLLESILNEIFNPGGTSFIYIDNTGDDLDFQFLYRSTEGYPAKFIKASTEAVPSYFNASSEYNEIRNFIVHVPSGVIATYTEEQIRSEVNNYRPCGTNFTIQIY